MIKPGDVVQHVWEGKRRGTVLRVWRTLVKVDWEGVGKQRHRPHMLRLVIRDQGERG